MTIHDTYVSETVSFHQYKYPDALCEAETIVHEQVCEEYMEDITRVMHRALAVAKPNTKLLAHQPYLNAAARYKLVDFALKMSQRLKVLPFVFCRAVRLFDRYCSKRVVLLDQGQLIIATCLWIAAKVQGGNCHFANLETRSDIQVRGIHDVGYGPGGRFHGPTQRYRVPRLRELVRLCGSRCGYSPRMFAQMELYIMASLNWNLTEPGIEEFLVSSEELRVDANVAENHDFWRMKQFLAYTSSFSYDIISYDASQVAKVAVDLINSTFMIPQNDRRFQTTSPCIDNPSVVFDTGVYNALRKHMIAAVAKAPIYLLESFNDRGPHQLFCLLSSANYNLSLDISKLPSLLSEIHMSPNTTPVSAHPCSSPDIFKEFTYECVTEVAKGAQTISDGTHGVSTTDDLVPSVSRRAYTGMHTPMLNPPNMNSHVYPAILPPSNFYAKTNDSFVSMRSTNSSKESEIFDHERTRLGTCTPASSDSEHRKGSVEALPPARKLS
ncbi:hypothetical protein OXX69_005908 [Metschnikowia pulcherrima]